LQQVGTTGKVEALFTPESCLQNHGNLGNHEAQFSISVFHSQLQTLWKLSTSNGSPNTSYKKLSATVRQIWVSIFLPPSLLELNFQVPPNQLQVKSTSRRRTTEVREAQKFISHLEEL